MPSVARSEQGPWPGTTVMLRGVGAEVAPAEVTPAGVAGAAGEPEAAGAAGEPEAAGPEAAEPEVSEPGAAGESRGRSFWRMLFMSWS